MLDGPVYLTPLACHLSTSHVRVKLDGGLIGEHEVPDGLLETLKRDRVYFSDVPKCIQGASGSRQEGRSCIILGIR